MAPDPARPSILKSKLFWVGVLYFSEGFPLGVFYEIFPVWFRQRGVDLATIGALSLLGLSWTLKFLWAPAIDYWRHHRRWMAAVDVGMGFVMVAFAMHAGFGPAVFVAIALFTMFSATNDIAIDGYTIELLSKDELGLANGVRIGMYRVGMLTSGAILMASDALGWSGAFACAAVIFFGLAVVSLVAPPERQVVVPRASIGRELAALARSPFALAAVAGLALCVVWLVNNAIKWSARVPGFWAWAVGGAAVLAVLVALAGRARGAQPSDDAGARDAGSRANAASASGTPAAKGADDPLGSGVLFGALIELLRRPGIVPVLAFILIFKLPDAAMGFMVKPFWVDAGFTAAQIGLVSVNIGLALSIAGGIAGGWITDRIGILHALWILGLVQAASNLGYWIAASILPIPPAGPIPFEHQVVLYSASAVESFTGGLGTAAFLAFLMAIVSKDRAATEYALLSSVFALSRSIAGWAGGLGAQAMGYSNWFLLTFFFVFPALLLLPWVKRMLNAQRPPGTSG